MAYEYTREKLWGAIYSLVGAGTIHERLEEAAMALCRLYWPADHVDLPDEFRDEFQQLLQLLTTQDQLGNGHVSPAIKHLSSEEAVKLSRRILRIYTRLHGGI